MKTKTKKKKFMVILYCSVKSSQRRILSIIV